MRLEFITLVVKTAKKASIVIINDNSPAPGLKNTWGWSAYIELDNIAILFDANSNPEIIEYNMKKLNIDTDKIEFGVLSHAHADHYGGFRYIGRIKPGLRVYIPLRRAVFLREWGLEPILVEQPLRLSSDVWISDPIKSYPIFGIAEIALGIRVDGVGLVVVVGCSHPGVDRISQRLAEITNERIFIVIGGYHNPTQKSLDKLAGITKYICPAHCSGDRAKRYVKNTYPEKYVEIRTGTTLIVDETGELRLQNYP